MDKRNVGGCPKFNRQLVTSEVLCCREKVRRMEGLIGRSLSSIAMLSSTKNLLVEFCYKLMILDKKKMTHMFTVKASNKRFVYYQ